MARIQHNRPTGASEPPSKVPDQHQFNPEDEPKSMFHSQMTPPPPKEPAVVKEEAKVQARVKEEHDLGASLKTCRDAQKGDVTPEQTKLLEGNGFDPRVVGGQTWENLTVLIDAMLASWRTQNKKPAG